MKKGQKENKYRKVWKEKTLETGRCNMSAF